MEAEEACEEPGRIPAFFRAHPEINIAGFAERMGINASLLRNYINGFKKPSAKREEEILRHLRALGAELALV